jgi:hypothetical protein
MTLKELMGNDAFKKELEEAAKAAAPKNDKEYFEVIIREAAKHGVETNENELRAYAVSKMPVDEKELEDISGGYCLVVPDLLPSCIFSDSCFTAVSHDTCDKDYACWDTYQCIFSAK